MGIENVKGQGTIDQNHYQHYEAKDGNGWYQRDGDGWHKYEMQGGKANKIEVGDITDEFDRQYQNDNPGKSGLDISNTWTESEEHKHRVDTGPGKSADAIVNAKPTDGSIAKLDLANNPFDKFMTPRDPTRAIGHDINQLNDAVNEWNKLSKSDRDDAAKSGTQKKNLDSAYSNVKNDRDNVTDEGLKKYLQSALDNVNPATGDRSISELNLNNNSYDKYKTARDGNRIMGHDINVLNGAVKDWNALTDTQRNESGRKDNLRAAVEDGRKNLVKVDDPVLKQNLQNALDKIDKQISK